MEKMDLTLLEMKDIIFDIEGWRNSFADPSVLTLEDYFRALADKVAETIPGARYIDWTYSDNVYPAIMFPMADGTFGDFAWAYGFELDKARLLNAGTINLRYTGYWVNARTGAWVADTRNAMSYKYTTSSGSSLVDFLGNLSTINFFVIRYWKYKDFYCLGGFVPGDPGNEPSDTVKWFWSQSVMFCSVYDAVDSKKKQCVLPMPQYGFATPTAIYVEDSTNIKNSYYPTWGEVADVLCIMPLVFDGRYYSNQFGLVFPSRHTSIPEHGLTHDPWTGGEFAINGTRYRVNQNANVNYHPNHSLVARIS